MYDFAGRFGSGPSTNNPPSLLPFLRSPVAREIIHPDCTLAAPSDRLADSGVTLALVSGHPRFETPQAPSREDKNEHLLHLARQFHKKGSAILDDIHGDFAIALYDRETQQGLLAIDRLGICPLAYAVTSQGLIFAGDVQTLGRHPAIDPEPNPQALFAYLYFHMIPAPLSVYKGIHKLLPGQYVTWKRGNIKTGFYWQARFADDSRSEDILAHELRTTLEKAIASCVDEPSECGTFLSGGLDSSTVTGFFQKLIQPADAFSIGFSAEGYDEMDYARATARHFGVRLHEYYVTPQDVVSSVHVIASFYDEPFGNASAVPTYYCARLAKDHGKKCLLAGDGGDELFAGNERYAKQKMFAIYDQIPTWLRHLLIEPLISSGGSLPILSKLKSYVEQAREPMPARMETYNFLHRTPLEKIFERDFLGSINTDWPLLHLQEIYQRPASASMLKRMLWLDWKITLADNDLRKVNRMCTLAGMDVRYPMLQEAVVELAARIPDKMLMRGFELRSFYRRAFQEFLAPETMKKSKHGFGLPFGLWLKTEPQLQSLAYDSLDSRYLQDILRKEYIDRLKSAHSREHASYYGTMIWVLMMWVQWIEQHQEQRA